MPSYYSKASEAGRKYMQKFYWAYLPKKILGSTQQAQKLLYTLNSNQSSSGIPRGPCRQSFPENRRGKARKRGRKAMRPYSQKWGYIRIITGTILGGILGFYVMHRLENNYKEKMNERLKNYEAELRRKKRERLDEFEESS